MIGIGGIALFLNSLFSFLNCIYLFIHSAAQHGMWKPSSPTKDKIPYPLHWKLRSPSDRDLNPGSLAPASINLIYYPTLRLGTFLSESPNSTKGEFRAVLRGSKCRVGCRAGVRIQSFWSLMWNSLLCDSSRYRVALFTQGHLLYLHLPSSKYLSVQSSTLPPRALDTPHQFLPQDLPGMGHHISIHGSWIGKRHSNPFAFQE